MLVSNSADGGSGVATVVFQRSPPAPARGRTRPPSWDTTAQADGDYDLRAITTDNAGNSFTSALITVTVDNTDPPSRSPRRTRSTSRPPIRRPIARDRHRRRQRHRQRPLRPVQRGPRRPAPPTRGRRSASTRARPTALVADPVGRHRACSACAPTDNAGLQTTELVLVTIDRTAADRLADRPRRRRRPPRRRPSRLAATASDTAPGGVNTVTFQRSPAGAGTWTDIAIDSLGAVRRPTSTRPALPTASTTCASSRPTPPATPSPRPATIQVRVDNTIRPAAITAPARRRRCPRHGRPDQRTRLTPAPASPPSSSSAPRPAPAPGRTRPRASNTTAARPTASTTSASSPPTTPATPSPPATITVRVDNTLPTGAVTAPAAGANVRGTIAIASNSADAGSGVATVQFQRSPAGAGTWTNQAASWDTTLQADGHYDLRVMTTDNAGNAFTSARSRSASTTPLPPAAVTAPRTAPRSASPRSP